MFDTLPEAMAKLEGIQYAPEHKIQLLEDMTGLDLSDVDLSPGIEPQIISDHWGRSPEDQDFGIPPILIPNVDLGGPDTGGSTIKIELKNDFGVDWPDPGG